MSKVTFAPNWELVSYKNGVLTHKNVDTGELFYQTVIGVQKFRESRMSVNSLKILARGVLH